MPPRECRRCTRARRGGRLLGQHCHHFTIAGADAPRPGPPIRDYGEVTEHSERPWGGYTVLAEAGDYKVKTIEVHPGQRLSYQRHSRRAEHWFVVRGDGVVTLDGTDIKVARGDTVDVGLGAAHRIRNTGSGPLVFVEVQHGDYWRGRHRPAGRRLRPRLQLISPPGYGPTASWP